MGVGPFLLNILFLQATLPEGPSDVQPVLVGEQLVVAEAPDCVCVSFVLPPPSQRGKVGRRRTCNPRSLC